MSAADLTEKEFAGWLRDELRRSGFVVHEEVYCREQGNWPGTGGDDKRRLDLYAIPPVGWDRGRTIFRTIGIECKIGMGGEGLINGTNQVGTYVRAFDFRTRDGQALARPDVVLLANLPYLRTSGAIPPSYPCTMTSKEAMDFRLFEAGCVVERFLWKLGGAILSRRDRRLGFLSNNERHGFHVLVEEVETP